MVGSFDNILIKNPLLYSNQKTVPSSDYQQESPDYTQAIT